LVSVALFEAPLVLSVPVVAADRTHGDRRSLFLRVEEEGLLGWGECAVAERPGPDAITDEVISVLRDRVLDLAFAPSKRPGMPESSSIVVKVAGTPAAAAAGALVEAALLDRELRRDGVSLSSSLGAMASAVGFAGVVGVDGDLGLVRDRASALVAMGATRLRVKVSPDSGLDAVLVVLDAAHVPVVADANGSLHAERDRLVIDSLCELPLAWLEQPFAAADHASHAILAQRGTVSVGLDESVRSVRSVRDIARYGAASVVCLKPARLGGIARAREVLTASLDAGLRPYVGGYFEAGLGRAVLGALSSLHPGGLDGDVAAPCTYLESDPCGLEAPDRGRQALWTSPGCGPAPALSALRLVEERSYAL